MNGFIKIYDVSRHEPKLIVPAKSGYDLFANFGEIIMAKCNVTGTHMAMTVATASLVPDGKLYIWDIDKDRLTNYDFLNKNEKRNPNETTTESNETVRRLVKREIYTFEQQCKIFLKKMTNFPEFRFHSVGTMKIVEYWHVKHVV